MGRKKAQKFINDLSKKLIEENKNIISGFGVGIGSFVITGALEEMYMKQEKINSNQLILRPFPQKTLPEKNRNLLWKKYREDMISLSGISVFVFGNKIDKDGKIIDANGEYSEFEIAKDKGSIIIPVGSTGYVAKRIWNEINSEFDEFYPSASKKLRDLYSKLNKEDDGEKLINIIIEFINECKKLNFNK